MVLERSVSPGSHAGHPATGSTHAHRLPERLVNPVNPPVEGGEAGRTSPNVLGMAHVTVSGRLVGAAIGE